ncbi:anti-repressor SinI family protein [Alkalibacillus silvisoli]|uniref:Sin domain-containing protein n=1 Tax=Alkalibacillus silvisoli TaxID=392823 RepID=A0ABP3JFX3_9BACI
MRTEKLGVRSKEILDREWVQLMKEAKNAGISKKEIKEFLNKE